MTALVPDPFNAEELREPHHPPELGLVAAVILRAVFDACNNDTQCQPYQRREARRWFRSWSTAPFSWRWAADAIGLSEAMRRRIEAMVIDERSPDREMLTLLKARFKLSDWLI